MTTTITIDEARSGIANLAASQPDRTNSGRCQYTRWADNIEEGRLPNCIVGQFLANREVHPDTLNIFDDAPDGSIFSIWETGMLEEYADVEMDGPTVEFLQAIQIQADEPWDETGVRGVRPWGTIDLEV